MTQTVDLEDAAPAKAAPPAEAPAITTWLAALAPAVALAACGGGGGDSEAALPAAFNQLQPTGERSTILDAPMRILSTTPVPLPTASEFLDWAERTYAVYFPGHKPNLLAPPWTYRYYPETQNYVGIANGVVYVYGPSLGPIPEPLMVGTLADFAGAVRALAYPQSDAEAVRFLNQATLAATDADIATLRTLGYDNWLTQEMAKPPSPGNWDFLVAKGLDVDPLSRTNSRGTDPQIWQRLIGASDSLRQRMTLALSEIFVVGFDGLAGNWKQFKLAGWWDLLCNNAYGNYRTLIEAITLNPAMGQYLSSAGNQKGDPNTGRLPDENYAREVMQLFSIGLYELKPDGTRKLDDRGNPIESYTQDTVTQLARVFTGWGNNVDPFDSSPEVVRKPMVLTPSRHETLGSSFLGVNIAPNTSGTEALRITLDTLAAHPNVGPFIGRQLIQRLVTSNPSPAYVGRVAAAWADNGVGVRGDLGFVLRTVLTDIEARDATLAAGNGYGKLREPVLRFVQWARTFKARSISTDWLIGDTSEPATRLNQSPLRAPSVFNFFRPGYTPAGTAVATAGLQAPEFQLTDESSVAGYLNMMRSAIPGGNFDLRPDYTAELALASNAEALVDRIQRLLCAGSLQAGTRSTIVNAVNSIASSTEAGRNNRVYTAILLVMASADYLIQK